ncbi:MAG: PQQ-dependent sugar dehydrogenase [Phycisphaerae bacterium]
MSRTCLLAWAICAPIAVNAIAATPLTTVLVADGLVRPIYVTHAPGDYSRIFIIEKQGFIRIVRNGALLPTPFLDIDSIVGGGTDDESEQGLLGLAFHPDYANNGVFYVYNTNNAGNVELASYHVSANPDLADAASRSLILSVQKPYPNHNAGWIDFGPDGYLYVAIGDGGFMNDPGNRAQTIVNMFLGKILRLDPDGPDNIPGDADDDEFPANASRNYAIPPANPFVNQTGDDEIWAYGLRNPWRCSFDRQTGDLWIADVGQSQVEEIDFQAAGSPGGANYGWRCTEGTRCTGLTGCTCNGPTLTPPIHTYLHTVGCAIVGGYVYQGCAIADLRGTYFFGDFCANAIWSFNYDGVAISNFTDRSAELAPGGGFTISSITSFGEDAFGELYVCCQPGQVFKIVPATSVDCNVNGVPDGCDITAGVSADVNRNGVPDECECLGDLNGDNQVNESDLGLLLASWSAGAGGDVNADGQTDESDLGILLANWLCNRP